MSTSELHLRVPLNQGQIDAAGRLSEKLKGWKRLDAAVNLLATTMPGFSEEEVLLKVAVINTLYSTRLFAPQRMAVHICKTLKNRDLKSADAGLVTRLAKMPPAPGKSQSWLHSFASKFAHRFIDPNRFPVFDKIAKRMIKHHLGRHATTGKKESLYQAFHENVQLLRQLADLDCSLSELDRYLWLAGAYRERLEKGANAKISRDAVELFENARGMTRKDLMVLGGNATP